MSDIKPRKRKIKPNDDFNEFRQWLTTLNMINPVLHINGAAHPIAVLAVDFGTPLVEQKLTPEQNAELVTRMRTATKALCPDKEVTIRIQNDGANGVWWSSTV